MKLQRSFTFHPALFPLIPSVNVLFLVVVIFALSARFNLQPGIAVALPASSFALAPQREPQIISITAAPVPAIYHRGQKIPLGEVGARLAQHATPERSVLIKADRATPYGLITQVMDAALASEFTVVLATSQEPR